MPSKIVQSKNIPDGAFGTIALRLIEDPLADKWEPNFENLTSDESAAFDAVLATLNTTAADLVADTGLQDKAQDLLEAHLSAGPMSEARHTAALNRLGMAGELSPSEYIIKDIQPSYFRMFQGLGESLEQVRKTLRKPDALEHFAATNEIFEASSIFVRRYANFFHLVVAKRAGQELTFSSVWKLPTAGHSGTPLALLKQFCERYGLAFRIGDLAPAKFRCNELLPNTTQLGPPFDFQFGPGDEVLTPFSIRPVPLVAGFELQYAFAVNINAYRSQIREDLRK